MTEQELAAIEARANAATPGPWAARFAKSFDANGGRHWVISEANGKRVAEIAFLPRDRSIGEDVEDIDALFTAAARTDVPALVAEVRRLRDGWRAQAGPPKSGEHAALIEAVLDGRLGE